MASIAGGADALGDRRRRALGRLRGLRPRDRGERLQVDAVGAHHVDHRRPTAPRAPPPHRPATAARTRPWPPPRSAPREHPRSVASPAAVLPIRDGLYRLWVHAAFQARRRLLAHRRPAEGDRRHRRGRRVGRARGDAAGRHRHRQDDDDGGDDRAAAAAGARARPQQDAGGPALQRVPDVLPDQRRRVLRLVLRLLPARGLRPEQGPLHREGLGDQPGDRPAAPRRHGGAVRPARRRDRGERVRHLRPRLAGDVQRQLPDPAQGRRRGSRRAAAQARLPPVQPQRHGARARHVPRAGRHAGGLPGLRRDRLPRAAVRRRGGAPAALRPADGRADRGRPRARRDLAGHALQRQGRDDGARGRGDRARAQPPHRRARGGGQAARVAPPAPAHAVRHGDAARGRLLLRHRELLADPRRAAAGRAALLPDRLLPRGLRVLHRRVAPDGAAARRHVRGRPLAQDDAGGLRLPAPERARQPAADVRRVPLDLAAARVRVRHPGPVRARALGHGRRADRAADRDRRPRGRGARDAQPDRRPDARDPGADRSATSGCSSRP